MIELVILRLFVFLGLPLLVFRLTGSVIAGPATFALAVLGVMWFGRERAP